MDSVRERAHFAEGARFGVHPVAAERGFVLLPLLLFGHTFLDLLFYFFDPFRLGLRRCRHDQGGGLMLREVVGDASVGGGQLALMDGEGQEGHDGDRIVLGVLLIGLQDYSHLTWMPG